MKKGVVNRAQVFAAKGLDERDFPDPTKQQQQEEEEEAQEKKHPLKNASFEELDAAEEEDDAFDDDRALARYREQRMKELREKVVKERFGDVQEICKADWVREVTEASKNEAGLSVIVHLYQDRVEECRLLEEILREMARKFKAIKFVSIVATAAVENWPDRNLPTLFIYQDGALKTQLLGLKKVGGRSTTAKDLEWWLASEGIVETEMEEDPRRSGGVGRGRPTIQRGYAEDDEDDD